MIQEAANQQEVDFDGNYSDDDASNVDDNDQDLSVYFGNLELGDDAEGDPCADPEDAFHIVDIEQAYKSNFLRGIMILPPDLRDDAFAMFYQIVQLRCEEVVPDSVYARIISAILIQHGKRQESKYSAQEKELEKAIIQFSRSTHLQNEYLKSLGDYINLFLFGCPTTSPINIFQSRKWPNVN